MAWSPQAVITGGCSGVQSVEVSPGSHKLLVGPASSGQILKRDLSTNTDNGATYAHNAIVGSIVMAQPGQLAELAFITLDGIRTGTRPTIGVLLGEISGAFEVLTQNCQDPPNLPASATLYADRYYLAQNSAPPLCRHLQIMFSYAAEDAANELLTYTIFGAVH